MAVLLASVQVVLYLVRDLPNAVILILIVTAIELAVFIPFTYRHAKSPAEVETEEAVALSERRQQITTDLEALKKRNL